MRKNNKVPLSIIKTVHRLMMLFMILILTGCGGGGGGDDEPDIAPYDEAWTEVLIADLSKDIPEGVGGLLEPQVNALQDNNGNIHFTYYNVIVAEYTVTADVSDVAGNTATQATELFTKDETTEPTIDILPVTGDNIVTDTEDDSVIINGTTTGVEAGQTVKVTIEDAGGNTVYTGPSNVTVDEFNTWIISDVDMSDLADLDGYTVFADVRDSAGNSAFQATELFNITNATVLTIDIFPVTGDNIVTDSEDDSVTLQGITTGAEQGQIVTVNIIDVTNTNVYSGTASVQADGTWSIDNVDLSALPNEDDNYNYGIFYKTYDPDYDYGDSGIAEVDPELVVMTDRCTTLSMTLKTDNRPVLAYQGGTRQRCGDDFEADVMFQVQSANNWTEYTGAIGYVERNPVFTDGYAGKTISITADYADNIHTAYQFFYEGCDRMNLDYPDQDYAMFSHPYSDQGLNGAGEETVDGNEYINNSTGDQHRQGDFGKILLNADGNPTVFYVAEIRSDSGITYGVKMAVRIDDEWISEWVWTTNKNEWEIGYLSPSLSPDGTLGVAYYLKRQDDEIEDPDYLRYSEKKLATEEVPVPEWTSFAVNQLSYCGDFCSLAYDSEGNPAIAYYTTKTYSELDRKNLIFSYRTNGNWVKETVAYQGNIGKYNTLWFNEADGVFCVSTYSIDEQKVYLYNRYE